MAATESGDLLHGGSSVNELRNKRIAIVLATLELGGSERQALHLASYLKDRCGARVAVVALFGGLGGQPVRQMCIQRRLACLRVNMPVHENSVPTFRSIRQFARDMAFLQPDVLLPYTTLPNVLCGVVWQRIGASACIWNQRDEGIGLTDSKWHNLALKNVTHFIANSRTGVEMLVTQHGVPREKIELIFNGVALPAPRQTPGDLRRALGLFDASFVAVMLGNITRHKDHATLVRAWKIVCDQSAGTDPILILAGREDDADALKHLIASLALERQVRLIGPAEDVSSLLHAADLAVFSSISEGTPNAVLESMAAGRAVVATDIPGCRDALGDGYAGLLPAQDPSAMAAKILQIARDEQLRNQMGAALAQRAADLFDVNTMCRRSCESILRALQ
jgi:glycosyltransferase involved in cell wall biosynthesis